MKDIEQAKHHSHTKENKDVLVRQNDLQFKKHCLQKKGLLKYPGTCLFLQYAISHASKTVEQYSWWA